MATLGENGLQDVLRLAEVRTCNVNWLWLSLSPHGPITCHAILWAAKDKRIRLEKSFKSSWHPKLHEEVFMKNSNRVLGEVVFCKEGHCTGNSRKLLTATTATAASSTSSKSEDSGDNKANTSSKVKLGNQENGGKQEKVPVGSPTTSEVHDQYADIMEIAEMDYSPAKRKPPIHN
ncbi:hypothetical protein V6N13_027005 [Hibiscus sabdariffa]|uniref:Uncharacterized protein n=1 Tax=Hibiscus sabdariffa TaxID=183260 RepID=A0ABR2NA06_9ROSI